MKAFPESTAGYAGHVVTAEGEAARRRHVVTFRYDDGSTRSFDGTTWTCVPPAPRPGLFDARTGKPVRRATRNIFGA